MPSVKQTYDESSDLLGRMLDDLLKATPASNHTLHRLVGNLRASADASLRGGTLGTELRACFDACYDGGTTYDLMNVVRENLLAEEPVSDTAEAVRQGGLILTMAIIGRVIADTVYKSREEIERKLKRVTAAFEDIRHLVEDSALYQANNSLASTVTRHLADQQLRLPSRAVHRSATNLPSLYLAFRVYADTSRSDEIIDENRIVHPAFCPLAIDVLTA